MILYIKLVDSLNNEFKECWKKFEVQNIQGHEIYTQNQS